MLALASPLAWAQEAPDVLVKRIAEETLTSIRADKELQSGNPVKVKQLIETKLVPHFDTARMTALAMGRNWRAATPEQQSQLTEQFKTLLIRTYSNALTNYRDNTMNYKPLRSNPGDTDVVEPFCLYQREGDIAVEAGVVTEIYLLLATLAEKALDEVTAIREGLRGED